ncbi:hypothetical protein D3C87_1147690 [compost metagenome]
MLLHMLTWPTLSLSARKTFANFRNGFSATTSSMPPVTCVGTSTCTSSLGRTQLPIRTSLRPRRTSKRTRTTLASVSSLSRTSSRCSAEPSSSKRQRPLRPMTFSLTGSDGSQPPIWTCYLTAQRPGLVPSSASLRVLQIEPQLSLEQRR